MPSSLQWVLDNCKQHAEHSYVWLVARREAKRHDCNKQLWGQLEPCESACNLERWLEGECASRTKTIKEASMQKDRTVNTSDTLMIFSHRNWLTNMSTNHALAPCNHRASSTQALFDLDLWRSTLFLGLCVRRVSAVSAKCCQDHF